MRISKIDDSNRDDHFNLCDEDECYYFLEYTSGKNYSFSYANSTISNLKKKPFRREMADYKYKASVIRAASDFFRSALDANWLASATLIPVPGSKAIGHPDYDDRVEQICRGISEGLDVRSIIKQTQSTQAAHEAMQGARVMVDELVELYEVDEALCDPLPTDIAVFDDVLTAGTVECH